MFHPVGHLAFRGVFNGFVAGVGGVFDELGDLHGEAVKNRRDGGDIVGSAGAEAEVTAVGIDPSHFNLQAGFHNTLSIASVSAGMSSIIAVAAYLKQSPLPDDSAPAINTDPYPREPRREGDARRDEKSV